MLITIDFCNIELVLHATSDLRPRWCEFLAMSAPNHQVFQKYIHNQQIDERMYQGAKNLTNAGALTMKSSNVSVVKEITSPEGLYSARGV